jgi:hypothetical protein
MQHQVTWIRTQAAIDPTCAMAASSVASCSCLSASCRRCTPLRCGVTCCDRQSAWNACLHPPVDTRKLVIRVRVPPRGVNPSLNFSLSRSLSRCLSLPLYAAASPPPPLIPVYTPQVFISLPPQLRSQRPSPAWEDVELLCECGALADLAGLIGGHVEVAAFELGDLLVHLGRARRVLLHLQLQTLQFRLELE